MLTGEIGERVEKKETKIDAKQKMPEHGNMANDGTTHAWDLHYYPMDICLFMQIACG